MSILQTLNINIDEDFKDSTKENFDHYVKRAVETVLAKNENPLDDKNAPVL